VFKITKENESLRYNQTSQVPSLHLGRKFGEISTAVCKISCSQTFNIWWQTDTGQPQNRKPLASAHQQRHKNW